MSHLIEQVERVIDTGCLSWVLENASALSVDEKEFITARCSSTLREMAEAYNITHEGVRYRETKIREKLRMNEWVVNSVKFIHALSEEIILLSRSLDRKLSLSDRGNILFAHSKRKLGVALYLLKCNTKKSFIDFLNNNLFFGWRKNIDYSFKPDAIRDAGVAETISLFKRGCIDSLPPFKIIITFLIKSDQPIEVAIHDLVYAGANETVLRRNYTKLTEELGIKRKKIPLIGSAKLLSDEKAKEIEEKISKEGKSWARACVEAGISYPIVLQKLKTLAQKKNLEPASSLDQLALRMSRGRKKL